MKVMLVAGEPAVRSDLAQVLRLAGHDIVAEPREHPDVAVLDDLQTCRCLRAAGDRTPVMLLSARDEVAERVAGLDAGADDWLPTSFAPEELLARLRALARRPL